MRQSWEPDELVDLWTLVGEDWRLVGNKSGTTRLGFALLLKFFEIEARFPAYPEEIPQQAVEYVASQVRVEPTAHSAVLLPPRAGHLPRAGGAAAGASFAVRVGAPSHANLRSCYRNHHTSSGVR